MVRRKVSFLVLSSVVATIALLPACGGGGGGGGGNGATAAWTHPANAADNISPDGLDVLATEVAMDGVGNAIVVWHQNDGTSVRIYLSECRNGVWTHPSGFGDGISRFGTFAASPDAAMDDSGNAIVVWSQDDGLNKYHIFKSERRNGTWTHPANLADNISPGGNYEVYPQVAMDNAGNAIIVWYEFDGASATQIFKSEFRNGEWTHPSGPTDNISLDGQYAYDPQVAMDDNGNAIIVWHQFDGVSADQIFKSEYRNGSWTHPSSLSDNISPDGQSARKPQVAMDDNGNAVVVWIQRYGSADQIFKSEYRNGAWTHPSELADNISLYGLWADGPQVAIDNTGNAIIVWYQSDGAYNQIFKSEYRNSAWTHPTDPADNISPDGKNGFNPDVAMDDSGNAIIVWNQGSYPQEQIYKSEYRNGAWTNPSDLADNISPGETGSYSPHAAMSNAGTAVIAWHQDDGEAYQAFMSEYR